MRSTIGMYKFESHNIRYGKHLVCSVDLCELSVCYFLISSISAYYSTRHYIFTRHNTIIPPAGGKRTCVRSEYTHLLWVRGSFYFGRAQEL